MLLSCDSQENTNGASSLLFFILFSSPVDPIEALSSISFPRFKRFPMPVHYLIPHLSLSLSSYQKCRGYLRRFVSPLSIRSSYFEIIISFKSFNLTGAIPHFNQSFNGVSFQWALTHRSFSRILPDSSNFPRAISQILFNVWCKNEFHQLDVFQDRFQIIFHCWINHFVFHSPGVSQQFMVVLIFILNIGRPKRDFS